MCLPSEAAERGGWSTVEDPAAFCFGEESVAGYEMSRYQETRENSGAAWEEEG